VAVPVGVDSGDELARYQAVGCQSDGTFAEAHSWDDFLKVVTTEAWTTTAHGRKTIFLTIDNTTLAADQRMVIGQDGNVGINVDPANEKLEVAGKIRANTAFNLNGTDGVTQAASAGKVCDVTALAGGIATAQTQITYAANGTYNFDATSGKVNSITITNGRITAITTAP